MRSTLLFPQKKETLFCQESDPLAVAEWILPRKITDLPARAPTAPTLLYAIWMFVNPASRWVLVIFFFFFWFYIRLFGCGISGLEWLQPMFWGRLQPLFCLVARMGSIRLLFGWRIEMGSDPSHFLFGWMDSNRTCIWSPLHWNGEVTLLNLCNT